MSGAPNFFRNPRAHNQVEIGGRLLKARLRAEDVEGLKIEAEWKEQKSTGTSGATQVYQGMKPAGPHKLTLVAVAQGGYTAAEVEDDLLAARDMMLPKPGLSGSAATSTATSTPASSATSTAASSAPTTAEGLLQQAQAALATLNAAPTASTAASTGAASSSAKAQASTGSNPGPKPPTLSIRNAGINDLGTTAISLKSYETKYGKTGEKIHVFELVPQKPVVPAGTGVAPAKSPDKPGGVPTGGFAGADAAASASAAAGAGT